MLHFYEFADFSSLSLKLTTQWLELVSTTPSNLPCSFALAGGTTPAPVYRQVDALLAASPMREIQLVATDERWVPDSDPQSNEGLFKQCFSQSAARLVSLKTDNLDPISAITQVNHRLQEYCNNSFSAVILGMGADGHIASLFPNAPELLVEDVSVACVAALHPQTQQARISLSFSRLLATQRIWLVITGAEKRKVLDHAANTPGATNPIAALLTAARCDVEVFWCP